MTSQKIQFRLLVAGLLLRCLACFCQQSGLAPLDPAIAKAMSGRAGAVVVLDVESGRVLAIHNAKVAAQRVTAPGSTVKPFVLMELLHAGKINPVQSVFCTRKLTVAGRRMDCTHSPAVKNIDATEALIYSCNTYFATVADRLSPAELKQAFERAGFTSSTGLQQDEAQGRVSLAPDAPHLRLQALGDWGVEVTPLELTAAYRKLALESTDASLIDPVFQGLEGSVRYGMAHAALPEGTTAAGKTGTAANRNSPETHGFFAGYAPADRPEIVVVVLVEQGRGSDAAAIAGAIFTAYAAGQKTR